MDKILVKNNLFAITSFDLNQTEVYFSPEFSSVAQETFWRERFDELSLIAPHLKWMDQVSLEDVTSIFALDAFYERTLFGPKLDKRQNRLLDSCPFPLRGFTPFKIHAEVALPDYYQNTVAPWDQKLIEELDYYFHQKKLPLTYLETRNELTGRDGSTKFSAYLSSGTLDVRYLYNQVREFEKKYGATKSTYWLIFELLWREYFYWHYQKNSRNYFSRNGLKGPWDFKKPGSYSFQELYLLTKEPFFHACLNELGSTGFLSNRARQIFASIWINDLELDWLAGASLFEENLIDYDVYSNYGNWMYLAGVGVDPRGKRYFNIKKQLETYDPQGLYLKKWL